MEFMLAKWEEQKGEARDWKTTAAAATKVNWEKSDGVMLKGLLAGRYENCFVTENLLFSAEVSRLNTRDAEQGIFNDFSVEFHMQN